MTYYQKNNFLLAQAFNSKNPALVVNNSVKIKKISVMAGPYKPAGFYRAHPLIFNSVVGKFPRYQYQQHGKREKETVSIITEYVSQDDIGAFLGRFINAIFPSIADMRTMKNVKRTRASNSVSFRMRYRFGVNFPDCEELIVDEMHDTKRGVFLPLLITIHFSRDLKLPGIEDFVRATRLPMSFYRWWPFSALDDVETI
jgi:hypothetical protein